MELRQIKQFLAVAETGSFTRGAHRAGVSQPAISSTIAKLETELGRTLFVRNKRMVALTADGERLQSGLNKITNELADLKASFLSAPKKQTIKIATARTFPVEKATQILVDLDQLNDALSFKLSDVDNDVALTSMDAGSYDLALLVSTEPREKNTQYRTISLGSQRYGVAVPKDHPLSKQSTVTFSDIAKFPFIARTHCEYKQQVLERMKSEGLRLKLSHRTNQDARALSLVSAGLGFTITPLIPTTEDFDVIPFSDKSLRRELHMAIGSRLSPELAASISKIVM